EARQAAELARAAEEEAIRKAEEESRKAARRKALQANPTIVADFEELRRQAMAELARDDSQETESQLQITPVDPGPPPPVPVTAAPVPPPPEVPPAPVTATMVPDDDAPPPPPVAPEAEAAAEEPPPEVIDEQAVEPMADVPAAPVVTGDGWAASVELLRREAVAAGDPAARVALLTEAAALARVHGPGAEAARALLDAAGVGKKKVAATPAYWRERAATHAALGDLDGARAAFQSLGAALSGAEAADAWVAASDLARRAGKDAQGFDDLRKAVEACADDVRALFVLLDALRVRGDSTVQVFALERLASLHVGSAAAALHAERARLLEKDRRRAEEAHDAWIDALTADAGHSGAFLALERAFRKAGEWDALTSLYKAEGDRLAGAADVPEATRGVEAAWWYARAARVARTQLFNGNLAGSCYALALAASPDDVELRNEYEAWCGDAEKWPELAQSLSERVERAAPEAKSFLQYRLARVTEERLGDVANALGLYRAAAADPAAAPAAEAVLRLLQQRGDHAELVKFLEQRLGTLADPSLKVTVLYRMGETCEGPLDDQKAARKHYEAILDFAPGYLPALEGLERVYSRQQAWADLAAVYEQRALLTDDPHGIALHRQRAGSVYDIRLGNGDKAREQYRLALEAVPDFPPSLDAYTRQLEALGDWASLARVLRTAANATRDANEAVSLVYRAGRVLADRTDDMAGAMACLERCLELSPGFLPAILLLKELAARAGNQAEYFRLERAQADMGEDLDRRHWRLLAAAEAAWKLSDADPAQLANEVLREDAHQPAALDLASRLAIAANDTTRLVELLQKAAAASRDDVERARICARIAELSADQEQGAVALAGVAEVIGATGATKRPLRTLARLAESLGSGEEALRALEAAGASESVEAARLRAESGDGDGAVRTLSALLAKSPEPAAAAALLRSAGGEPSDRGELVGLRELAARLAQAPRHLVERPREIAHLVRAP
ncbi:MAG: tetratricopeptide repeat protein, partial [Myxococcota bacterium]